MIDEERFLLARERALSESAQSGVGTLSEKALHKILKIYFDPCEENHEIPFLGSIADIKNEEGIIEIQTRAFTRLVPKLLKFLAAAHVTVVYPIVGDKTLRWLDKSTGELTEPKKSPKKGRLSDALAELSAIREFIPNENLTVRLVILSVEEYKYLDGWDKTGKRGATKIDRVPTKITDVVDLEKIEDYRVLIPAGLPKIFKAKDFNRAAALRGRKAHFALKFLASVGLVEQISKEGNAFVYKVT